MQQITKWKTNDGTEFSTDTDCIAYEKLCDQVEQVMSLFPKRPENDGCRFSNGEGFIQLSEKSVSEVRGKLIDLIATKINHPWVQQSRKASVHHSYIARLLSDYGIRPLEQAWYRLSCIDKQWREWGQPYYAEHPNEGEQTMIASV